MNNQQKLDRITSGKNVLHAQIPAVKNDPAFPKGWSLSAEYCIAHGYINTTRLINQLRGMESTLKNMSTALVRVAEGEPLDVDKLLAGIYASNESQSAEFRAILISEVIAAVEGELKAADISSQAHDGIIGAITSITTTQTTTAEIKEQP